MADFINTIDLLGDEVVAGMFVDGSLTEFNDDVLTTLGGNSFNSCTNLESVSLPNLVSVAGYAFAGCSNLKNASFPKAAGIGGNAFQNCSSLINVDIPKVKTINSMGFYIAKIDNISLPSIESIGSSGFAYTGLKNVYLPATPPTLSNVNAFEGINANCVFHIPVGSLSAYQSATNWSTLTGQYTFQEDA